ncbi:unnamed protein product [Macrosiphum euphorbiae]|uniref:SWIM-type domain-containing protein n=1 Tax=Macrosiphum euphorbiae TaxID=13131 RepID=A0AAV0WV66_9HEMI|nr:unnamed protein product [Macrosiphum euphorbiae]
MNNIRSLFLVFVYSYSSFVFCTKFGLLIAYKCNVNFNNDPNITIKSLVIQTSKISEMPHEITGKLLKVQINNSNQFKLDIKQFFCSCKAGASECCKHTVAVPVNTETSMRRLIYFILKCW